MCKIAQIQGNHVWTVEVVQDLIFGFEWELIFSQGKTSVKTTRKVSSTIGLMNETGHSTTTATESGSDKTWNLGGGLGNRFFIATVKAMFESKRRNSNSNSTRLYQNMKFEASTTVEETFDIEPGKSIFQWQWVPTMTTSGNLKFLNIPKPQFQLHINL